MPSQEIQKRAWSAYEAGFELANRKQWNQSLPLFAKAFSLHNNNVRYALFLGAALWHTDNTSSALELWSLGADHDPMLRLAQYQPQADAFTRQTSNFADTELRGFMTNLQTKAISEVVSPGRIKSAIWPQTHIETVSLNPDGVRPHMFFAKDLPETPVFNRNDASWTKTLEAHAETIRAEYLNMMETNTNSTPFGEPYVHRQSNPGDGWDHLRGQMDWTSIHLFKYGIPHDATKHCPQTVKALSEVPSVLHNGNPMEVFFSVLKPGTHIPAHYGLANSRVTVHLPLIIPRNCAIRVKDIEHNWIEGETFIFDDSFNHEAWNKSEDTRVVLIFEAWRPDMTEGEILAVQKSYAVRSQWMEARKVPDLQALIDAT